MARFTNQAQLTYSGGVTNSNIAEGELLEVLSATKTAVYNTYTRGETVTYIVSLVNTGTTEITGLTLSDDLGTYTQGDFTLTPLEYIAGSVKYYQNGVLQTTPTAVAGPPLVISGISVPAGGNTTVAYEARTNRFAPLGTEDSIVNTVTVSGGGISPITAAETVSVNSAPDLTITKSISPVPVTENGRLTYTFTIQNYGNTAADAAANVVVTDTFNPILRDIAVAFNGTAWAAGTNYTYNETTGEFSTVAGQIIVPAATYTQSTADGSWIVTPGVATLTVTGTV